MDRRPTEHWSPWARYDSAGDTGGLRDTDLGASTWWVGCKRQWQPLKIPSRVSGPIYPDLRATHDEKHERKVADRAQIESETGNHDGCLEKETRFGAYSVVLKSAKGLNELLRIGLGLRTEDQYLEVHVPDSVEGTPRAVLGTFKKGALELADFLSEKRLKPRWLIGVTHQNVARPARRFLNFRVISGIPDEAVDRDKTQRIAEGYGKTKRREGGVAQGLYLCYQSYAAFMDFAESLRRGQLAGRGLAES